MLFSLYSLAGLFSVLACRLVHVLCVDLRQQVVLQHLSMARINGNQTTMHLRATTDRGWDVKSDLDHVAWLCSQ